MWVEVFLRAEMAIGSIREAKARMQMIENENFDKWEGLEHTA